MRQLPVYGSGPEPIGRMEVPLAFVRRGMRVPFLVRSVDAAGAPRDPDVLMPLEILRLTVITAYGQPALDATGRETLAARCIGFRHDPQEV